MKNSVSQWLFGASQFFKTSAHGEAYQGVFPKQHLQALFYAKKELEKKEGETEQDTQKKSEERIEKINQTLSAFASNPLEEAQPNYPDPVVKIINDYQQLAVDRASGSIPQEQMAPRQSNLNQSFNNFIDKNPSPLSGLVSAVGQKVATKAAAGVVSKVAAAAAGIVNPILGAIVGFVSKELISKAITWLNRNKKRVLQILGGALAIGGLLIGGVGGALALGTGVVFIGAGAIGAQGISGGISSTVNAIGQFTTTIGVSIISSVAVVFIIAIATVPLLVGFILFIINSGAYIVPPVPFGAAPGAACRSVASGSPATAGSGGVFKIMALGDSITRGYVPPGYTGGEGPEMLHGYRLDLYNELKSASYNMTFVGTQTTPKEPDTPAPNHEGYGAEGTGFLLSQMDRILAANIPDVVLIHAGTNHIDPSQGGLSAQENAQNVSLIIDKVKNRNPKAVIVLAKIIQFYGEEVNVANYNNALTNMYNQRTDKESIALINMQDLLTYKSDGSGDYVNSAHPNPRGYKKMADAWFAALQKILGSSSGTANLPVCATGCFKFEEGWPVDARASEEEAINYLSKASIYMDKLCSKGDIMLRWGGYTTVRKGGDVLAGPNIISIYTLGVGSLSNSLYTLAHESGHIFARRYGDIFRQYVDTAGVGNILICTYPLANSSGESFAEMISLYDAGSLIPTTRHFGCMGGKTFKEAYPNHWKFARDYIFQEDLGW